MFKILPDAEPPRSRETNESTKKREAPPNDNFKKMSEPLSKEETEARASGEGEEEPFSLFDLSRQKPKPKKGTSSPQKEGGEAGSPLTRKNGNAGTEEEAMPEDFFASSEEAPTELSPDAPDGEIAKGTKEPKMQPMEQEKPTVAVQVPREGISPKLEPKESFLEGKTTKKEKTKEGKSSETVAATSQEKGNIGVNTPIQGISQSVREGAFVENESSAPASTMREIASQIADTIQVMKKEGTTETLVTLKNPPLLEGATITLTEFDHAKGEFNIRFANLSPEAKQFLDQQLAQDPLKNHLDRKGVVVHMVSTTTQPEPLAVSEAKPDFNQNRDQEQKEQQQKRQQQQKEEKEE